MYSSVSTQTGTQAAKVSKPTAVRPVIKAEQKKDSLSDQSSQDQLKLQAYQDRRSQTLGVISSTASKASDASSSVISYMK